MSRKRSTKPKPAAKIALKKENDQFLEALKLYEGKQYKKSLKLLDAILKKDGSHVDSLALKGLDLYSVGEKDDAASYVANAIRKIEGASASPICCHVLGIYMRNTKEYKESIKWFTAALNNGSTNKQIYRDLATLQSQIGDFKNALVSRKKYWEAFLGYRANWTSLAVAQDVNGERQQAINTLSQFEKLAEGKISDSEKYEHSECLMYKNDIMYKAASDNQDKLQNVLKHLNDIEPCVFDKFGLLERKATIYMKLGQLKDASIVYRTLIKRNPDNFKYYKLLEVSLGIQGDNKLKKALYGKLEQFYPRCEPPKFIPLTFLQDKEELSKKLREYVLPQLKRGVPATFSNVKPLYQRRKSKVSPLLEKIVLDYLSGLDPTQDPIPFIWTNYYLSQHFLFLKDFPKAQEYIDAALDHTPTLVEFYILKARILKHLGLMDTAAGILEEGRQLDLQDRFINCKTVKYFLRANNIDKAVEVASLFTKNDDSVNGIKDLHLVEASWFIVEQAEAYYRLYLDRKKKLDDLASLKKEVESDKSEQIANDIKENQWLVRKYKGLALKRFNAIPKFYKQFEDDQLDFHSYCMRKGTPRAYLEMLEWGKALYTKPMYVRAMKEASKLYFQMHDDRLKRKSDSLDENSDEIQNNGQNSSSQKKKAKKEAAAMNKRKETEAKSVAAYPSDQDDDVFGEKLIETSTPMEDFATEFYNNYSMQVREDERDYILDFEFNYRIGKLALCFASLNKFAKRFGTTSGLFGSMAIVLLHATRNDTPFDPILKKVVTKSLEKEYSENFPLNEISNNSFDWLNFYQEKFGKNDINGLLFLYRYRDDVPIGSSNLKEMIISSLSPLEPHSQNEILQYYL
ncbi:AEG_G0008690.mRNA.1.CDS.1 [Saccharomyces cerevisiae]|nr:Nat1p [Saccharomyces cerevisiae YJM1208]CAI4330465.1 AEG_G0008690.mRNA.1.CDS.1 [Saccharomyces cerevisiae]CAI6546351.1 AEG_G0008690.mRNA.1.CDS.1 [Saccharomyces cerevisiae]